MGYAPVGDLPKVEEYRFWEGPKDGKGPLLLGHIYFQ